jgi:hypothetical protein
MNHIEVLNKLVDAGWVIEFSRIDNNLIKLLAYPPHGEHYFTFAGSAKEALDKLSEAMLSETEKTKELFT